MEIEVEVERKLSILFKECDIEPIFNEKHHKKMEIRGYPLNQLSLFYDCGLGFVITHKNNIINKDTQKEIRLEYGKDWIDNTMKYNLSALLNVDINIYSFYKNMEIASKEDIIVYINRLFE